MFVDINNNQVSENEVKILFEYEDLLKSIILNGHGGKVALRHLKENTYKKYMLYQRQIRTTYKVFK